MSYLTRDALVKQATETKNYWEDRGKHVDKAVKAILLYMQCSTEEAHGIIPKLEIYDDKNQSLSHQNLSLDYKDFWPYIKDIQAKLIELGYKVDYGRRHSIYSSANCLEVTV